MSKLETRFARDIRPICLAIGIPQPEREFRFALDVGRQWRFDFAWPEFMIAVEIDGGTTPKKLFAPRGKESALGGHVSIEGFRESCHKLNVASLLRWAVIRGDSKMVTSGHLVSYVEDALRGSRQPSIRGPKPYMRTCLKILAKSAPKKRRRRS